MKKRVVLIISFFLLLFIVSFVSAEKTVKTISVPLGFVGVASSNTQYISSKVLDIPDRIYSVEYAEMYVKGDFPSVTTFYPRVRINGVILNCSPVLITTPSVVLRNYEMYADCSVALKNYKGGLIEFGFQANKQITNVYGRLELTYMNNPHSSMVVHGTEYDFNDNGTIFIQLVDSSVNSSDVLCELNVFYPNKTSYLNTMMSFLNNSNNIFYHDLVVPNVSGVFISDVFCLVPSSQGNFTSYFGYSSNDSEWVLSSTVYSQNYYGYGTIGAGVTSCLYDIIDIPSSYFVEEDEVRSVGNITDVTIFAYSGGTRNTDIYVDFWKYNSFTNTYTFIDRSYANVSTTSTPTAFTLSNISSSDFLTSKEKIVVDVCMTNKGSGSQYRFYTGTGTLSYFNRDTVVINMSQSFIYRGSGEMHVNNHQQDLTNYSKVVEDVWNASVRNLTYYPSVSVDYGLVAGNVWNVSVRNLTFYPEQLDLTNYSRIDESINASTLNITGVLSAMDSKLDNILSAFSNVASNVWGYFARYTHGEVLT